MKSKHMHVFLKVILCIGLINHPLLAQEFDLLLKGGQVIDPANEINSVLDIAIKDGKIAATGTNLDAQRAKSTIDVSGMVVAPGLIDPHTHVFVGSTPRTFANGFSSVSPDDFSFKSGITTMVDAGTSGWRNFETFKSQVIDQSSTRVLAFINIVGVGMVGPPSEQNIQDMDPYLTGLMIKKYPDIIVGTKIGHYTGDEFTPVQRALDASATEEKPLLVECHLPEIPLEVLMERLRPGDIFTHAYGRVNDRASILDEEDHLKPAVAEARKKGVYFDVGHGGGSFHYSEAIPATKQGFWPDSFGSDLHRFSMNSGMKDMLNIMSKFLNLGMPLYEVISSATSKPAAMIKRPDLGNLSIGAEADIAVLSVLEGEFGFIDSGRESVTGSRKLQAELTLRAGRIMWDLNGLGAKKYAR
ncbi:MAG: amidohydrolase/deacetylase family metallohydrolase [Saprospiraceae bacterium]|nr:amidohydrolase/deacetylase family metallohydrolase [Saprospiraceae bacterium]